MSKRGDIIESFKHIEENNTIEIVFRKPSRVMLMCDPPRPKPDKVWKEVYSVKDGIIKLTQTIRGRHIPARKISSNITFDI